MNEGEYGCSECRRRFTTLRGLQIHRGTCRRRGATPRAPEEATATSPDAPDEAENELRRQKLFQATQHSAVVSALAAFRYDMFTPGSHVDKFKHVVAQWVGSMQEEVLRRLAPLVAPHDLPTVRSVVAEVMDTFKGIGTAKTEAAALAKTLPLLDVHPRTLGTRPLTVTDAEGHRYRSKEVSSLRVRVRVRVRVWVKG